LNTMGACSHSITPAVQTLNFGCGENCQYETAASLFVLQSQDAWGVRNRLRTVWRQTQADLRDKSSLR
jgi:hypothetical protein